MNDFDKTRISSALYSGIIARVVVRIKWLIKGNSLFDFLEKEKQQSPVIDQFYL